MVACRVTGIRNAYIERQHGVPTCRDMSELVTDYMERAVPFRTRLDMWLHLLQCDACRRYFDQVRRTARLLGARSPAPPDSVAEDSMLALTREKGRRDT